MQVNISNIQRRFIIGLVGLIFLLLNIFIVVVPFINGIGGLRNSAKQNNIKISKLQDTEAQKQALIEKDKFFKREFLEVNYRLPNYLVPENFVEALKGYIQESMLQVQDISFTKPEEYKTDIKPKYPISGVDAKKADDIISGYFKDDGSKDGRATQAELKFDGIAEEKPMAVGVSFFFSGTYDQVKAFTRKLETDLSNVVISSIMIVPSKEKSGLEGKMELTLFGFKDSKIPVYNLWTTQLKKGKADVFGKGASTRYNINSTDTSDFDIALNPFTSDSPTVILRKHGSYTSGIYGDNALQEPVQIQITEKNGKLYYRYQTATMTYPDNGYTELVPATSNQVIIKVYSMPRVLEYNDDAGINLIVSKPANLDVKVQVYNDDSVKPRVKYEVR